MGLEDSWAKGWVVSGVDPVISRGGARRGGPAVRGRDGRRGGRGRDGALGRLQERLGRLFGGLLDRALELLLNVASRLLELSDRLSQAAGEFGHLVPAEEDQDHNEYQQDLRSPEPLEKCERCGHEVWSTLSYQQGRGPATL